MKRLLLILIIILLLSIPVHAEETCEPEIESCEVNTTETEITNPSLISHDPSKICIIYFYGEGCSKCAQVEPFMQKVAEKYRDEIHLNKLELYHNLANYQLYNQYCAVNNIPVEERGIPFVAIGHAYLMGVDQIEDNLEDEIEALLESGERICPITGKDGEHICNILEYNETQVSPLIPGLEGAVTLPLILTAGLIDGINPCAFAVLIFLLAFLLEVSNNRKRMVKAGTAYIVAVYVTYFLAGLGLLTAIQFVGMANIVMQIAAVVAIIFGAINIKDYFWYGRGFSLAIPESGKPTIMRWVHRTNIPAAIVLGFLVSMFELPCTGGVYLAILAMLASSVTFASAVLYLLVYNLMFILPLIVIMTLVVKGMSLERIEQWRTAKKNWMKLFLGIVLIILGAILLLGMI